MRAETIAERLRGEAEVWRACLPDNTLCDTSYPHFTESVIMAFGLDFDMPVFEAFDKLADMFDAVAKAAKVDTEALREVADELDADFKDCASIAHVNLIDSQLSDRILEAIGDAD